MLLIVFRKMFNNKWMTLCTLIGAIVTVAVVSIIPMYTDGIMQRMLTRDLELSQNDTDRYPGGYEISQQNYDKQDINSFESLKDKIEGVVFPSVKLPVMANANCLNTSAYNFATDADKDVSASFTAFSEIQDHIKILHGKPASPAKNEGAYEVMATEGATKSLGLVLGHTYLISKNGEINGDASETFKIKLVGIFTYKSLDDVYWFESLSKYDNSLFMDMTLFRGSFLNDENIIPDSEKWYYAFDYHKITTESLSTLVNIFDQHKKWLDENNLIFRYRLPMYDIIKKYFDREKQLKVTLLVLQIPILLMLAFYSFMVSKMKIDFESTEIAILKSRGAGSILVFLSYLAESLIIGLIALFIGPVIGLYLSKILGSSNGFLEFVQRTGLPLVINRKTYLYSLLAMLFISATMLIPAAKASRTSIVLYKQKKARKLKWTFWEKYFIDLILIILAYYGYYNYKAAQKIFLFSGIKGTDLNIDPLLFMVSTMFILGSGLLILRIFPYLVRFIFWAGRKIWNPVFYSSFIQIGRTVGQEQFVMLFIILTLSIGVFNACSARTINKNTEDKLRYEIGADITVVEEWRMYQLEASKYGRPEAYSIEPLFERYKKLSGVEAVTKVFRPTNPAGSDDARVDNLSLTNVALLGIVPNEFGKVAWFRNDLLYPYHWYQYLNMMTDAPKALLVSKAFKEKNGLQEGDNVKLSWGSGDAFVEGTIYAFIDYWPSLNPNKKEDGKKNPYFVVANLDYLQAMNTVEPYQVWIKKKPAASSNDIYKDMAKNNFNTLIYRRDVEEELIKAKNDPMLQGMNGAMTLDFMVTIVISIIGFLIYWIVSIKKRVLQFGIFRAMGLSFSKVVSMLALEQLLITGTSIAIGIFIGNLTSKIFIPMFELVYTAEEQVPPFSIISDPRDYMRLFIMVALMLVTGFIILRRIILKINVSQALKLGED